MQEEQDDANKDSEPDGADNDTEQDGDFIPTDSNDAEEHNSDAEEDDNDKVKTHLFTKLCCHCSPLKIKRSFLTEHVFSVTAKIKPKARKEDKDKRKRIGSTNR